MMISVHEADKRIQEETRILPAETVALRKAAGRVLREEICADRDMPPFHRSIRDGIAVSRAAWLDGRRSFRIEATQLAGQPPRVLQDAAGGCIQIMTGAVLPDGCNGVLQYEDLAIDGDAATVNPGVEMDDLQYVHPRASDRGVGDTILQPGCYLNGPRIGIVASTGKAMVRVAPFPRIAMLSNGDELVDVGQPIEPFQVRLSNNYAVAAALERSGMPDVAVTHVPDDPGQIETELARLLDAHDVIVLSGGVSAGKTDFIPAALERLSVRQVFHKVSQRPGKPLWFGVSQSAQPVFALPGNPVSTLTCLQRYVVPHLGRMMGAIAVPTPTAIISDEIRFEPPLTSFRPVRELDTERGTTLVSPVEYHGSGDHSALAASTGFVELDAETEVFAAGTRMPYTRWR